ncbi:MAG: twin-arginine translocation signal domain-containing protein [Bacteroidia bacterium]
MDRREFVRQAGALTALAAAGLTLAPGCINAQPMRKKITIAKVDANFDRQKLRRPFGFKGFLTNNWQTAAYMETDEGIHKVGAGHSECVVVRCDHFSPIRRMAAMPSCLP